MVPLALDPAWIAAIATAGGAILLKVTEHFLNRNRTSNEDARQIRTELRDQIISQKEEIARLQAELDTWRSKYYDLRDSYMQQHTELTLALASIKKEAELDTVQVPTLDPEA